MGVTTTTGAGAGNSYGGIKGPHNKRNFYVSKLTPHVVAAGKVTLVGGAATVTFPSALAGGAAKYSVQLTVMASAGAGHEVSVTAMTDNSDGDLASFAVAGAGATDVVMWSVVRLGNA